jgi:paraquat-inducible protein B
VTIIVVLGAGELFARKKQTQVMFFQGSVKGLSVGAPVVLRGVKIGEVTAVKLRYDPRTLNFYAGVLANWDRSKIAVIGAPPREDQLAGLIAKGLRARLEMQSVVTGQLLVSLDFYPRTPVRLYGFDKLHREIPTIPAAMEELGKSVAELPLKEIARKLDRLIASLDRVVSSPRVEETLTELAGTLRAARALIVTAQAELRPLLGSIRKASVAAGGALAEIQNTVQLRKGVAGDVARQLSGALAALRATMTAAEGPPSLNGNEETRGAQLGQAVRSTLAELAALARSLRGLSDYLEQHPETLLRGRPRR